MASPIRRAIVKQQPIVRVPVQKVPPHHAHGCARCGRRFADNCARPLEPRVCLTCKVGHEISKEDQDRLPVSCCSTARLITDVDILSKYGLAGHTSWWRCDACARTHPFQPEEKA